jgi:hypothetical protein
MIKAGDEATRRSCERMDQDTDTDLARLQKLGVIEVTFSPSERQELASVGIGGASFLCRLRVKQRRTHYADMHRARIQLCKPS